MMNQDSCYLVEIEIPVTNMRKLENSGKSLIHLMSNVNVQFISTRSKIYDVYINNYGDRNRADYPILEPFFPTRILRWLSLWVIKCCSILREPSRNSFQSIKRCSI